MDELSKSGNTDNVPSPFEFLLINCFHYKDFREIITEAFKFFIYEPVNFLYEEKKIVIGDLTKVVTKINKIEELITISEEEFFDF